MLDCKTNVNIKNDKLLSFDERVEFYLGNKIKNNDIVILKNSKNIEEYYYEYNKNNNFITKFILKFFSINSAQFIPVRMPGNLAYLNDLSKILKKYKDKKFLVQLGDRLPIKNNKYDSWSFSKENELIDNCSLVKIRKYREKNNVILRSLNFDRHWKYFYNKPKDIDFNSKINKIFWRGTTTGTEDQPGNRFLCIKKWFNKNNNIDIGFSFICQNRNKYEKYVKGKCTISEFLKYKYILSISGNDKDSGINWKLNSNSLVLMCKPRITSWLMETTLIPNYHYVLLKDDYSDLEEKHEWCNKNQNKCREIINNANNYMKQFLNQTIENKIEEKVLKEYFKKTSSSKIPKILFTSYLCEEKDEIVQKILKKWKKLNPEFKIKYFSDNDINNFFKNTKYYNIYKKLKNGVAIADFFRICYLNKFGGYWFDIDLPPRKIKTSNIGKIHLFDCGFSNISYMLIGGIKNKLFDKVIENVSININNNYNKNIGTSKYNHLVSITGPKIIQNIIAKELRKKNKNGWLKGENKSKTYLKYTDYEFEYISSYNNSLSSKIDIFNIYRLKSKDYYELQKKYKKKKWYEYSNI